MTQDAPGMPINSIPGVLVNEMDTNAFKKFMRPDVFLSLCLSAVGFLGALIGIILTFNGWLLLALAGSVLIFYALVYHELKVYRDRIKTYEASGELESLAAEFQGAQESYCKGRLRLANKHFFVQGECEAYAYEDIVAIEIRVIKEDNKASLYITRKDHAIQTALRSLEWRKKDSEIEDAVSAIIAHNPEIKVIKTNL